MDDDEVQVVIQPEPIIPPSPIVPVITEEPVVIIEEPTVTMQDELATVVTPTSGAAPSFIIGGACNNSEKLGADCNAHTETITYQKVEEQGTLAGGILDHQLTSEGLVSNAEITPDGSLKGGKVSGHTKNEGLIEDVDSSEPPLAVKMPMVK